MFGRVKKPTLRTMVKRYQGGGSMSQLIIITTTSDAEDVLGRIADRLVGAQLAACCQICGPIKSIYRWNGNVESSSEFELKVKTASAKFDEVSSVIKAMHNYDVPQIVALDVSHIEAAYGDWMDANLS